MTGHTSGVRGVCSITQEDEEIMIVTTARCWRGVTLITLHHHPAQEGSGLLTERLNKDVRVRGVWEPERKL